MTSSSHASPDLRLLWKYAQGVGDAEKGAVTHRGGAAELRCYADI